MTKRSDQEIDDIFQKMYAFDVQVRALSHTGLYRVIKESAPYSDSCPKKKINKFISWYQKFQLLSQEITALMDGYHMQPEERKLCQDLFLLSPNVKTIRYQLERAPDSFYQLLGKNKNFLPSVFQNLFTTDDTFKNNLLKHLPQIFAFINYAKIDQNLKDSSHALARGTIHPKTRAMHAKIIKYKTY